MCRNKSGVDILRVNTLRDNRSFVLVKMADEKVSIKMKVAIAGVSFTLQTLSWFHR